MNNRRLHLRGLTSIKQLTSLSKTTQSRKKASRILISFVKHFWECFFERLWKFRCEIMIKWEKENQISTKDKKKKKRSKKENEDKENIQPSNTEKGGTKEKEERLQKEALERVD